jgi:hypothetical protein
MRKIFLLLLTLFTAIPLFAQIEKDKDTAVYLPEVNVFSKNKRQKTFQLKTKGYSTTATLPGISEFVCLVREIPKGKLQSIRLFFNPNLSEAYKRKWNIDYKPLEIELKIYESANRIPATSITNDVRFIVDDQQKKAIELDLTSLNIDTSPELFFGIGIINPSNTNDMILQCLADKNATTFYKGQGSDEWGTVYEGMGINIKMVLTIEE